MGKSKRIELPDDDENARIERGIAEDPDTWVPSDEEWARAKPLSEVDPDLYKWLTESKRARSKLSPVLATGRTRKQRPR